jgi:hypothetical protein
LTLDEEEYFFIELYLLSRMNNENSTHKNPSYFFCFSNS